MSSRPQFSPHKVITDGDMSADITSEPTIIQKLSMVSYSITWDGSSPSGDVVVEVSNDFEQNSDGSVRNAGTWTELTLSAPTAVSGDTGTGFIDITQCSAYAIRLRYIFTSGTGTMNAVIAGKVA